LLNEFVDHDYALHTRAQTIRRIEVWSDFAEGCYDLLGSAPRRSQ
jgi:hypothetical protein